MTRVKVMHVTGGLSVGGVDEMLWITAKYNLKQKYDLAFATCRYPDGYSASRIENLGYKVYGLNTTSSIFNLKMIPKLRKVVKEFKPTIIHLYYKVSIMGRIAAKLASVPIIICNEVDMNYHLFGTGPYIGSLYKKRLNFLADKIIACSEAVRKYWDTSNSNKYMVMYLPIDMEQYAKNDPQPVIKEFKNKKGPIIGMVSRIFFNKGHEYLIQAMPKILEKFPKAQLHIIGTGILMDDMKKIVNSQNLNSSVKFLGFVEDLQKEISLIDVFVLPSLSEGFPLSIMEAMASGVPVAATPVGGIPEIIEHGKNGLLFHEKDPNSLADAVIYLLSDPDQAIKIGERGRQTVIKNYSPEHYIQQLDNLYDQLLKQKGLV